jgi:hypothetical protein
VIIPLLVMNEPEARGVRRRCAPLTGRAGQDTVGVERARLGFAGLASFEVGERVQ